MVYDDGNERPSSRSFNIAQSSGSFHHLHSDSSDDSMTGSSNEDETEERESCETWPVMNSIHARLEQEIGQRQHQNIDLLDFVEHVWGLERAVGRYILSRPTALDGHWTDKYLGGLEHDKSHENFIPLAEVLLNAALVDLGRKGDAVENLLLDANNCVKSINCTDGSSNPVLFNLWGPASQDLEPGWSVAKHIVEFKPRRFTTAVESDVPTTETEEVEPAHISSTAEVPKRHPVSASKRPFDTIEDAEGEEGPPTKKAASPLQDSHLPYCASRSLAATSRYWITGLIVDSFKVTVCYFDRCLAASTAPFFFDEHPERLALVLYAMINCDRAHAGFDPHLLPHPSFWDAGKGSPRLDSPVKGIVGSFFEYHPGFPCVSDPNSRPGRQVAFKVCDVIRRPSGLITRGTAVYKVQLQLPSGALSEDYLAYKLSWALKERESEIEIVKLLKDKLPAECHVHLPEFLYTCDFTPEDLHVPWLKLGLELTPDNHEERVHRGMLGTLYGRLWEAGSIENFKRAWLDCVECHYLAFRMGKVLHRDLSEGNLMIRLASDGKVNGVLNDWDMARYVGDEAQSQFKSEKCIGTFPFMALDLLEQDSFPHWLRHDLESFFYILIWAAVHYNLSAKTRDDTVHPALAPWTTDLKGNTQVKTIFLGRREVPIQRLYSGVKPEFFGVLHDWIDPLRCLFSGAQEAYYDMCPSPVASSPGHATMGGTLTFKTFMAAIKATPRTWGIPGFLDGEC